MSDIEGEVTRVAASELGNERISNLWMSVLSAKLAENRVDAVESPHPYGQVASVAISRIGAILSDV